MPELASRGTLKAGTRTATLARRVMMLMVILLSGGNLLFPRLPLAALALLMALLLANPVNLLRRETARIWLFIALVTVVSQISADQLEIVGIATRLAGFAIALVALNVYLDLPKSTINNDLKPLFIFFSLQAIGTPILAAALPSIFIPIPVGNTVYYSALGIFNFHQTVVGSGFLGLERADGFFFESGVLQIFLNIFLYLSFFAYRNMALTLLALFGVLSTQSSMGLVIAFALCGYAGMKYLKQLDYSTTFVAIFTLPMIIAPIAWITYKNIYEKLFGALGGSTAARSFDAEVALRIVSEYPLLGIGFSPDRLQNEFFTFGRQVETILGDSALERSLSNGLLYAAVTLGIPLALFFVYALLRQRLFGEAVVGGTIILLSMLTEALIFTPFFAMIAFSGLLVTRKYSRPSVAAAAPSTRRASLAR